MLADKTGVEKGAGSACRELLLSEGNIQAQTHTHRCDNTRGREETEQLSGSCIFWGGRGKGKERDRGRGRCLLA